MLVVRIGLKEIFKIVLDYFVEIFKLINYFNWKLKNDGFDF